MIKLERILVPTDFSDFSTNALRYGCELANRFDSALHIMHSVEEYQAFTPESGMLLAPDYLSQLKEAAERELKKLPESGWFSGGESRIVRSVRKGTPFLEIVRYARENESDLIVIGTHGRSGLSHALMGSVAEKVVRKAPCPVLTVRPGEHEFVMP
jgi:nucleotide-binding universal stress UspA family protein